MVTNGFHAGAKGVRFVFFDVGATLIHPHPTMGDIYRRVLAPLGIEAEPEEFMRLFGIVWTELSQEVGAGRDRYRAFGEEMSYWRTYVGRVLARLGGSDRAEEATIALHRTFAEPSSWALYTDVLATLERLRASGLRLGIISNWDSRLPALLEGIGLGSLFEPVVYSSSVGHEKPAAGIFREALTRAGVSPGEAAHVGDDLSADYRGAEAVGMTSFLVDRQGTAPENVRRVGSLAELPELLRELDGSNPLDRPGPAGGKPGP